MVLSRYLILTVLVLLIVANPLAALAQATDKDKAEALQLAIRFSKRMQRTQDVGPLINEFFTKASIENIYGEGGMNGSDMIAPEVIVKLNHRLKLKFFVAFFNFMYVGWVYGLSTGNIPDHKVPIEKLLPKNVLLLMKRDPWFSKLLTDSPTDDVLNSLKELESVTKTMELIVRAYQSHLARSRKMSWQRYQKLLNSPKNLAAPYFGLSAHTCGESRNCPNLPDRTPVVTVSIPTIHYLDIARIDGQLRVVIVGLSID